MYIYMNCKPDFLPLPAYTLRIASKYFHRKHGSRVFSPAAQSASLLLSYSLCSVPAQAVRTVRLYLPLAQGSP